MNRSTQTNHCTGISARLTVAMALLFIAIACVPVLAAQTAPAGAVIGNQATASYSDASGVTRTAFSNLVQTTVTQVYTGTLASTQARYATIGTQVVFPHTYTNTGNGTDTVKLSLGTASSNFLNPAIYMDANGDGVPDNTTPISSATAYTLAPGQVLKVVVVGTLGASAGASEYDTIIATSGGGGTVTGTPNTDTIYKTTNAAIAVTKAMSASSGVGGNTVGVTLTYTNTGNATSGAVVIADPLGSTTTAFAYVAGSGKWNGATLTDGSGGWVVTGNTPTLTIPSVAPGVTGTITFNVTVGASAPIGGTLTNTATFSYGDGSGTTIPATGTYSTNAVPFTVQQSAAVAWTAGDTGFTSGTPATDTLGAQTVSQGGTLVWTDTLTNSGNGYDTFNITYSNVSFPAGTTFQLFRVDGLTPLTDSNGDGILDSGPIAAGATATIKVKATLPPNTTTGAAWQVNVIATSTATTAINYSTATATDQDKVTVTIAASAVDLTVTASANGTGPVGKGSGVDSAVTSTVNPGGQVIFPFYVQNTSSQTGSADAYSLIVQTTVSTGNVTVSALSPNGNVLPTGWSAIFHQASGSSCPAAYAAQATPVTSTPSLAAAAGANATNSYQLFCLEVDVPAGNAGGTNNFLVQALSNATGAIDQIHFAVSVNTLHSVTVTPNQSGQAYAGGTVVYKHVITNAGNATETITFPATPVTFNPALSGWTATLYQDTSNTGILTSSDVVIVPGTTTYTLAPGASAVVLLKIQAAASANPGDSTDSTFTIQYQTATLSATTDDVTTVITGQIKLVKSQQTIVHTGASACVTVPVAGNWTTGAGAAASKDCVFYQIVATNTGTTSVSNPAISDTVPPYTTPYASYNSGKPAFTNTCSLTDPTPSYGTSNNFTGSYTTTAMTPGCTITVVFEVQLN